MSLTRAGVEQEVVNELRGIVTNRFVSLSTLVNGSNPDLNGPIRRAVRFLGGNTADPLNVADADLAGFSGLDIERLISLACAETLRAILPYVLTLVDVQVGEDKQMLSQLSGQIRSAISLFEQRANGSGLFAAVVKPMSGQVMPNDPFRPCQTRSSYGNWPYP